jgi:hypothetical protein
VNVWSNDFGDVPTPESHRPSGVGTEPLVVECGGNNVDHFQWTVSPTLIVASAGEYEIEPPGPTVTVIVAAEAGRAHATTPSATSNKTLRRTRLPP